MQRYFKKHWQFISLFLFLLASTTPVGVFAAETSAHKVEVQYKHPLVESALESNPNAAQPENSMSNVVRETYLVIPVLSPDSGMNAYGDFVKLVANDFAVNLREATLKSGLAYTILQPSEVESNLRQLGLQGIYQDTLNDFRVSRRPDPEKVRFLANKFSNAGTSINGLLFVEAHFDPIGGTSINKQIKSPLRRIFDISSVFNMPETQDVNYRVDSTVSLFKLQAGESQLVWQSESKTKMPLQTIGSFQNSIYSTDTALNHFSVVSHSLSQNMISSFPGLKTNEITSKSTIAEQGLQSVKQLYTSVHAWVKGE